MCTSALLDAFALCYGCLLFRIPANCACNSTFLVNHTLSCPKGVLLSIRHNGIIDLKAKLLSEICLQVATEPKLQPVSSEDFLLSTVSTQDGTRLNIVINELLRGRSECEFADVRMFNPFVPSNNTNLLSSNETIKNEHADNIRIREPIETFDLFSSGQQMG